MAVKREKMERPTFEMPKLDIETPSDLLQDREKLRQKINRVLKKHRRDLKKKAKRKKQRHQEQSGE